MSKQRISNLIIKKLTVLLGIVGDLTGNVTGNLTGNVTGNVTGNLTGNVTGNVTGNATGNLTGNVTGKLADSGFLAVTADGAIAVPSQDMVYFITKGTAAALTIVDPTATTHDNRKLTFVSTTAAAHTLDNSAGAGFWSSGGASKDIATFGAAIANGLTIIAYQGKWYIDPRGNTGITLG
jgi:hypothetical protein